MLINEFGDGELINRTDVFEFEQFPRRYRDRCNPLEIDDLSDEAIRSVYRFNGNELSTIANDVSPFIDDMYENETLRGKRLSALEHVIIAMKFYGHGTSFRSLGEQYGVGIGTTSRVIHSVTNAIQNAYKDIIKFPSTHEDCLSISNEFHSVARIPNVVGCVDGCLIPIKRPTINEHVFVCRKGYHAINAMFVCRKDLRFTFVDASYPGATQDAAVFRESKLKQAFSNRLIPQGYLIGDSGYGLSNHLLTPVQHPSTIAAINYNKAHRRTRNCIERAFGVLKSSFRCIDKSGGPLRFSPPKCANIINAVAILHNLAIQNSVPILDVSNDTDARDPSEATATEQSTEDPQAIQLRDNVISLFH